MRKTMYTVLAAAALAGLLSGCGAADDSKTDDAPMPPLPVLLGTASLTTGIPGDGRLTMPEIREWIADERNHETFEHVLPLGLDRGKGTEKGLDANPLTRAKIELGRQLFFDPRLSADDTTACAVCHIPGKGYTDSTPTGVGIHGQTGNRNSPVAFNRILSDVQFWDGRAATLEEQAIGPIANPIEMGNTHEACVAFLGDVEGYRLQFERIFGEVSIENVGKAMAAFQRVLVTGPSPYDYWEDAQRYADVTQEELNEDRELAAQVGIARALAAVNPLSDSAVRGQALFFDKANCTACHLGANFTDEKFHNLGVGMDADEPDLGRGAITGDPSENGAFKTPTTRNVTLSAPYMHDGSLATLAEVVEWYDKGGHPNPTLSDKIVPLNLTAQEKADLVDFMKACTGPLPEIEMGRVPPGSVE